MKITAYSVLAAGIALCTLAAPASAAPVVFCSNGGINLVTQGCISGSSTGYDPDSDGYFSQPGDTEAKVEQSILLATGAVVDLQLYGKSDSNGGLFSFSPNIHDSLSGTWDVLDNSVLIKYITVKGASSYALYELAGAGANSGSISTLGLMTPNNTNQPDISHISFWLAPATAVPEPASWAMLIAGLGVVGFAMRRRKGDVSFA